MITYKFVKSGDFDFSFDYRKIGKKWEKSEIEVIRGDKSFMLSGDFAVFDKISDAAYFGDGRVFVMFDSYGTMSQNEDYRKFQYNRPIRHFDVSRQMARIGYIILKKYIRHIGMSGDIRVKQAISDKWRFWKKEISLHDYEKSLNWLDYSIHDLQMEKMQKTGKFDNPADIAKNLHKLHYLYSMLSPYSDTSFKFAVDWYKKSKSSKAIEKYLKMVFYQEWVKSQKDMFSDVMLPFSPI